METEQLDEPYLDTLSNQLEMWVIHAMPEDFSSRYVARCISSPGTGMARPQVLQNDDLEELRSLLPAWLHKHPCSDCDDPTLLETWL